MAKPKIPVDLILQKLTEDAEKTQERVSKASDILLGPLDSSLATTPYDVVYEEDRVKLKAYQPVTESQYKTPLLVTYALINRETMLDLQPGRSVVQNFLESGIDLYMIDWGYPTRKDRFLTIDDHVNGYMHNIVEFICDRHKVDKINMMGICMGGNVFRDIRRPSSCKRQEFGDNRYPNQFRYGQRLVASLDANAQRG